MKHLRYLVILPFLYAVLSPSCANTSMPPSGGPKDTIPPVIVGIEPDSNKTEFPLKDGKITLKFNEYVALKDESKYIFLSPPLKSRIETKIRGKSIITTFPEKLDSGITYTLEFGRSITDNNEGNQFPPYFYPFSTGKIVDSMLISGRVYDFKTLLPLENIIIAVYENLSDTAVYKLMPSKIAKSDKWGYFVVKNLKPVKYKIFAYGDKNDNFRFDPENETIAFTDSIILPSMVMKKGSEELKYISEKDTSASLARPAMLNLYLFKEPTVKQYIVDHSRPESKKFQVIFASPSVRIDSLGIEKMGKIDFIKQLNKTEDTLKLWPRDTSVVLKDTLNLIVKYYKTDSLNKLYLGYDTIQMSLPKTKKTEDRPKRMNFGQKEEDQKKNIIELKLEAQPDMVEQYGYTLLFPAPVIKIDKAAITMESVTPRGQQVKEDFIFEKDASDSCIYNIKCVKPMKQGFEYRLTIAKNAFTDIYKKVNDSIRKSVILPNDENMSRINLDISGVEATYIVELTNLTRDKVFRSFKIDKDCSITFPYITPGSYSVRITKDSNNNGIIDTGSLADKREPEMVRLYTLPGGSNIIKITESVEINQKIDLKKMFK